MQGRVPTHSPQPADNFVQEVIDTQAQGFFSGPSSSGQNRDLPPLKGVKSNLISDPALVQQQVQGTTENRHPNDERIGAINNNNNNIYVDGGEAELALDNDYTQDTVYMDNNSGEGADEGESIYMIDGVQMRLIQIEGEEQQYLMDPNGRIYDMQANFIGTANTQGIEDCQQNDDNLMMQDQQQTYYDQNAYGGETDEDPQFVN